MNRQRIYFQAFARALSVPFPAPLQAKRSNLEEEYRQTKEALVGERVDYARLTLDASVLSGLLRVRDEYIGALEGFRPEASRASAREAPPATSPQIGVMNSLPTFKLNRALHESIKDYMRVVEAMFQTLAREAGAGPGAVPPSAPLSYEAMLALGRDLGRMEEADYVRESAAFLQKASEVLTEYEMTGNRAALMAMRPVWERMATVHIVDMAVRPDLVRTQMIGPVARVITGAEREELRQRLRLTPRQLATLRRNHEHHLSVLGAVCAERNHAWRQAAEALSTAVRPRESMGSMMEGYLTSLQVAAGLEKYADTLFAVASSYCRELFGSLSVEQSLRWMVCMPKSFAETTTTIEYILQRSEEEARARAAEDAASSADSSSERGPEPAGMGAGLSLCNVTQWLDIPHGATGMGGSRTPVIISLPTE